MKRIDRLYDMIPYWILFAIPAWLSIRTYQPTNYGSARWSDYWKLMFVGLVVMIGFRVEVGVDWFNYFGYLDRAPYQTLFETVALGDPAYELLNWFGSRSGWGIYFVNTASAFVFAWGVVAFCREQPRAWLALTVAVPYLIIVVAMNYTRQSAAIGLVMLGLVALVDRRLVRFALFIALAAAFHKSAVILMPLAALSSTRNKWFVLLWAGLFSGLLYLVFLQEAVAGLQHAYLEAEYQSSGAAVRVFMNAVPAVVFLLFRNRFHMPRAEKKFWIWVSLIALVFVVLLKVSPSSTALDRIALYMIPLQLFVLSRLPEVLGRPSGRGNEFWVLAVVLYCALIQFVWLFYADHAHAWLPYQFYPWVWYWQ